VSKKSYGFMEIASAAMMAVFMVCVYFLLFRIGWLHSAEFGLAVIITLVTTVGTIVTTFLVIKLVKH
jgi:uncharacterized membrane protein (DUF485 family)